MRYWAGMTLDDYKNKIFTVRITDDIQKLPSDILLDYLVSFDADSDEEALNIYVETYLEKYLDMFNIKSVVMDTSKTYQFYNVMHDRKWIELTKYPW